MIDSIENILVNVKNKINELIVSLEILTIQGLDKVVNWEKELLEKVKKTKQIE